MENRPTNLRIGSRWSTNPFRTSEFRITANNFKFDVKLYPFTSLNYLATSCFIILLLRLLDYFYLYIRICNGLFFAEDIVIRGIRVIQVSNEVIANSHITNEDSKITKPVNWIIHNFEVIPWFMEMFFEAYNPCSRGHISCVRNLWPLGEILISMSQIALLRRRISIS
jgi:hypothetical protein